MNPVKLSLSLLIFAGISSLDAQNNFQYSYATVNDEAIAWIIPSNDGNMILAGNTNALDLYGDGLIMKTDLNGNIIWSRAYGGLDKEYFDKVIACSDGGYLAVGVTNSYGQANGDAWMVRIGENGDLIWSSCLGTYDLDGARAVTQLPDGHFMVVGQTYDFDYGFMLLLDVQGNLLWKKEITLTGRFWFNSVRMNNSGGYFFIGAMNDYGFGIHDTFIMETDPLGNLIKGNVYGGTHNDSFRFLIPWKDGFLAFGDSWSWNGRLMGWIAEINKNLEIEKSVVLGAPNVNQFLASACIGNGTIYSCLQLNDQAAYLVSLDSALRINNQWMFNPGNGAYSSSVLNAGDHLVFSGYYNDLQNYSKNIYLVRFDPHSTVDCNSQAASAYAYSFSPQTGSLDFHEPFTSTVYQKINLAGYDISFLKEDLCNEEEVLAADFTIPEEACAGDPVEIINNSLNAKGSQWFFPGAEPLSSTLENPGTIRYDNAGVFTIKLLVRNGNLKDSLVKNIVVYPDIDFSLGPDTTVTADVTLQFILIGGLDSYLWSTGDTTPYLKITGYKLNYGQNLVWLQVRDGTCTASDTISIFKMHDQDFSELVLYPNPAWEGSLIKVKFDKALIDVSLYNMLGQKIMIPAPFDNSFNVLGLEPGVYTVEMFFERNRVLKRLILL